MTSAALSILLAILARYAVYFGIAYGACEQYHLVPVVISGFAVQLLADIVLRTHDVDVAILMHPRVRWFFATNDEQFILAAIPISVGACAVAYGVTAHWLAAYTLASAVALGGLAGTFVDIVATITAPGRDPWGGKP